MNVLIGCEESGTVREAFRALGHNAWSCDLEPCSNPIRGQQYHIQGDINDLLDSDYQWDLIILHPSCTRLCVSGNGTYAKGKPKHHLRIAQVKWTQALWHKAKTKAKCVCLEQPVGVMTTLSNLPKPQYIQPWMFGHKETKKTALFLHNLPPLEETSNVKVWLDVMSSKDKHKIWYMSPGPERARLRSITYQGIADSMATQWSVL